MKKRKKPHKSCRRDQALSFRTRHYLYRQRVALAGTRQLRSQDSVSVHVHTTELVTRPEGREGANGVGRGIRVGDGNRDGNGGGGGNVDVNGNGDGDGARTRTRMKANEGMQDESGDGSGNGQEQERGRGWRPVDEHSIGTRT